MIDYRQSKQHDWTFGRSEGKVSKATTQYLLACPTAGTTIYQDMKERGGIVERPFLFLTG